MRTILFVGLAVAGIVLAGTSGASAAPVNGAAISDLAIVNDHVTPVRWHHWGWGHHRGWGWGHHRGHWAWGHHRRWYGRAWRRW